MTRRRQEWRSWVALVAAYFLVFQSLFAAFAIGASAAPAQLDGLGYAICSPHGAERAPGTGDPAGQGHMPACCIIGCTMFAQAILSAPDAAARPVLFSAPQSVIVRLQPERRVPVREGSPGNPRAPPPIA